MGVERCDYVIVGVKLDYDEFWSIQGGDEAAHDKFQEFYDNEYREEIGSKDGVTVISDGMNGKYVYIGYVIKKAREGQGLGHTKCKSSKEQKAALRMILPVLFNLKEIPPINVWIFSHYY